VNSFARRQHLFDVAATPIDVDSNILSLFQFGPKLNHFIVCWWLLPPADLIKIRLVDNSS